MFLRDLLSKFLADYWDEDTLKQRCWIAAAVCVAVLLLALLVRC